MIENKMIIVSLVVIMIVALSAMFGMSDLTGYSVRRNVDAVCIGRATNDFRTQVRNCGVEEIDSRQECIDRATSILEKRLDACLNPVDNIPPLGPEIIV